MIIEELESATLTKIAAMQAPIDCGVIEKTTPVISFGDFTRAKVATLGINPSSAEFLTGGTLLQGDKKRLKDEEFGAASAGDIWSHCKNYFNGNPYWTWFRHLEDLIQNLGASYKSNACHLDLSPWATDPIFGNLMPDQQKRLLEHDQEFLNWQIVHSPIKTVLFNGATVFKTIEKAQNYYLQKVGEIKYTSGGQPRTSDLIVGDGPRGESFFGWTVNLQALKATNEERAQVMASISDWLIKECKVKIN